MTDLKHTHSNIQKKNPLCDQKEALKALVEYLADLAAEEQLKQASQKQKP
ncbi:MAG: hypothetical protein MI743_13005 [Sneathiellales bacterium]|nr:hypothetical protein [Sneathiellales bacterium]